MILLIFNNNINNNNNNHGKLYVNIFIYILNKATVYKYISFTLIRRLKHGNYQTALWICFRLTLK